MLAFRCNLHKHINNSIDVLTPPPTPWVINYNGAEPDGRIKIHAEQTFHHFFQFWSKCFRISSEYIFFFKCLHKSVRALSKEGMLRYMQLSHDKVSHEETWITKAIRTAYLANDHETLNITVSFDGSWQKRGFTSKHIVLTWRRNMNPYH